MISKIANKLFCSKIQMFESDSNIIHKESEVLVPIYQTTWCHVSKD
jgi:hypothetical protein